jgi:hypothetical protein
MTTPDSTHPREQNKNGAPLRVRELLSGEAVAKAVREFLRLAALRELKGASCKVDYVGAGEEMEALELRENQPEP